MRVINYLYISVIILLGYACSLDRNPLVEYAEDEFWTTEENAELALTAIY